MAPGAYLLLAARRLGSNTGAHAHQCTGPSRAPLPPFAAIVGSHEYATVSWPCWWSSCAREMGIRFAVLLFPPVGGRFLVVRTLLVRPRMAWIEGAVLIVTWWGMRARVDPRRRREVRTDSPEESCSTGRTDHRRRYLGTASWKCRGPPESDVRIGRRRSIASLIAIGSDWTQTERSRQNCDQNRQKATVVIGTSWSGPGSSSGTNAG